MSPLLLKAVLEGFLVFRRYLENEIIGYYFYQGFQWQLLRGSETSLSLYVCLLTCIT